jgi:hypothetical protein
VLLEISRSNPQKIPTMPEITAPDTELMQRAMGMRSRGFVLSPAFAVTKARKMQRR